MPSSYRIVAIDAAGLALAACEKSALNPNDKVALDGTIEDAAGLPIASTSVGLFRTDSRVSGSYCFNVSQGSPYKTATSDTAGKFHFDLIGSETQTGNNGEL